MNEFVAPEMWNGARVIAAGETDLGTRNNTTGLHKQQILAQNEPHTNYSETTTQVQAAQPVFAHTPMMKKKEVHRSLGRTDEVTEPMQDLHGARHAIPWSGQARVLKCPTEVALP